MREDAIASTAMLGLSGFRVLAVSEHDGEVKQAVEKAANVRLVYCLRGGPQMHDRGDRAGA